MTIAKVEVERLSLTSSKPFDAVVAALKSAVGQPNMAEWFKETRATNSFPDLERVIQRGLGRTGLLLFAEFDLGDILRRETGAKTRVPGSADRAPRPQVLKRLLFQHAARLNEQAAIDRLM